MSAHKRGEPSGTWQFCEITGILGMIGFGLLTFRSARKFVRTLSESSYPAGCCRVYGYDLTGNVSGHCPECGGEIGSSPPP